MRRLYSFLWSRMDTCGEEVAAFFRVNSSIFVPFMDESNLDEVAEGMFLSLDQVYWRDQTGSSDLLKKRALTSVKNPFPAKMCSRALCQIYPDLQYFFVNRLSVQESPDFDGYVRILQNLSRVFHPSEAYKEVIQVLYKWAEDIESERVDPKEISCWKHCLNDVDCSIFQLSRTNGFLYINKLTLFVGVMMLNLGKNSGFVMASTFYVYTERENSIRLGGRMVFQVKS